MNASVEFFDLGVCRGVLGFVGLGRALRLVKGLAKLYVFPSGPRGVVLRLPELVRRQGLDLGVRLAGPLGLEGFPAFRLFFGCSFPFTRQLGAIRSGDLDVVRIVYVYGFGGRPRHVLGLFGGRLRSRLEGTCSFVGHINLRGATAFELSVAVASNFPSCYDSSRAGRSARVADGCDPRGDSRLPCPFPSYSTTMGGASRNARTSSSRRMTSASLSASSSTPECSWKSTSWPTWTVSGIG